MKVHFALSQSLYNQKSINILKGDKKIMAKVYLAISTNFQEHFYIFIISSAVTVSHNSSAGNACTHFRLSLSISKRRNCYAFCCGGGQCRCPPKRGEDQSQAVMAAERAAVIWVRGREGSPSSSTLGRMAGGALLQTTAGSQP